MIQDYFDSENRIYKITRQIDLNGEEITIPSGCTLDFQGGYISNGVINLNSTRVLPNGCVASDYLKCTIHGTYAIGQCLFDVESGRAKWWTGIEWINAGSVKEIGAVDTQVLQNRAMINSKIDRESDGYYPKIAVGIADNLAGVDVVDSVIKFRRSGDGSIADGVARIESVKGNSVVWNQIANNNSFPSGVRGGVSLSAADGYIILNGSCVENISIGGWLDLDSGAIPDGHRVLIGGKLFSGSISDGILSATYSTAGGTQDIISNPIIITVTGGRSFVSYKAGTLFNNARIKLYYYDLTKMFGAGNEPTTIAEFNAKKPMNIDEYIYNKGEIIHMNVHNIESQGANVWDEEWEEGGLTNGIPTSSDNQIRSKNYIPVLPNAEYYSGIVGKSEQFWLQIALYDIDYNFIERVWANNKSFITPANAYYIKMATNAGTYVYGNIYNNDICINLSDASINGKYFPYVKRGEDLSIIRKYFPDGMKSVNNAHDDIRYNKDTQKREKVEAIGTRTHQDGDADNAAYLTDGKATCYPLAEPIVTELDEVDQFKDLDYAVWNAGTEKAIAEGKSAPLAADITYGFNAIGKIKELESLVAALRAKVGI